MRRRGTVKIQWGNRAISLLAVWCLSVSQPWQKNESTALKGSTTQQITCPSWAKMESCRARWVIYLGSTFKGRMDNGGRLWSVSRSCTYMLSNSCTEDMYLLCCIWWRVMTPPWPWTTFNSQKKGKRWWLISQLGTLQLRCLKSNNYVGETAGFNMWRLWGKSMHNCNNCNFAVLGFSISHRSGKK